MKFGSLIAMTTAIVCLYFFFGAEQPERKLTAIEPARVTKNTPQPEFLPTTPTAREQAKTVKSADLRSKFLNTKNYGTFIYDAMQKPDEGGRFYAYIAYQKCSGVQAAFANPELPVKDGAAKREKSIIKLKELQEKCASVKTMFASEREFTLALKTANSRHPDALMGTGSGIHAAKADEYRAELEKARSSGDPIALAATLEANIDHIARTIDPAYKDGNNHPILYIASAAAVCEYIGTCESDDQLDVVCAVSGNCQFRDIRDFLKAEVDPQMHDLYEKSRKAILELMRRTKT